PAQLREGAEAALRTLRRERLDVVHIRFMPTSGVPFLESLDALLAMQAEGKIRHLGLSNVGVREIEQALARTPRVSLQNTCNVPVSRGARSFRCRPGSACRAAAARSRSARTPRSTTRKVCWSCARGRGSRSCH